MSSDFLLESVRDRTDNSALPLDLPVPHEKVEMALSASTDGLGRIVCLCAEPGSGRHEVIARVQRALSLKGAACVYRDLHDASPAAAAERVIRAVRVSTSKVSAAPLLLDGVPPADEMIVSRIARALRRACTAGVSVLFSADPEASQLVEALPESVVLSAPDFAVKIALDGGGRARSLMRLTRGMPALVKSLATASLDEAAGELICGTPYYDALSQLVWASVRPSLSNEERRARLAMLLLGRGTVADLEGIVEGAASEILESMIDRAPLFGIAGRGMSFDCLTAASVEALAACMQRLEASCALFADVTRACFEALVRREEFSRSALLGSLPECEGHLNLGVAHGMSFLDAGEPGLVRRAIGAAQTGDSEALALAAGLRALTVRSFEELAVPGVRPDAPVEGRGILFVDARRFLRGQAPLSPVVQQVQGGPDRRLWSHRSACDLMLHGSFTAATRTAISVPLDCEGPSVSAELLRLDLEMARLMSGDGRRTGGADNDDAYPLLTGSAALGMSGYLTIARLLRAVIEGTCDAGWAEQAAARAERSGEVVVQVVALLAGCVCDLRENMATRARVRALLAESLAEKSSLGYLERVARLLVEMGDFFMGEWVAPLAERPEDDLGAVCALLDEAMGSDETPLVAEGVSDRIPWDALWLLRIVCQGLERLSELVGERMPPAWRRALRSMDVVGETPVRAPGPQPDEDGPDAGRRRTPIEVTLLGGFAVRVHGIRIPDWKLERRNARSMLEYMVLEHGNNLKRFRLVDQVWPECDYVTGFARAYQATSVLRRAIAEIDSSIDPFVTSRTSKEITLDMGLISCDVDEFKRVAREASDGDDDATTLRQARRAEELYEGDLCLPPVDATGVAATIRAHLRELYADAMVAGAAAALRLGQSRTAGRLAHNALIANDLREDAMAVLVRALRESGRGCEAALRYEAFSERLSNKGLASASRALASAEGDLAEKSQERERRAER